MMKKVINIIIVILLISLILISSYNIFKELMKNKEQDKVYEEIVEIVEPKEDDNEDKKNLEKLYDLNNDFIGWLEIEKTTINYPIMQSKDKPNFYLDRDFYKNYSSYGTPYISEQCDINMSDNIVIYGHHMKNKAIFGALEDYKKEEFYNNHQIITFETLDKKTEFQIFAIFKTTAYRNNSFKYYEYINFQNINDYDNYIKKCKELSLYETNKRPHSKCELLTLSTCEYSKQNGRLVVIAYEINS